MRRFVALSSTTSPRLPATAPGSRMAVAGIGLGLAVPDHVWRPGDQFSYGDQSDAAALTDQYAVLMARVRDLIEDAGLNAAVYTQLTDAIGEEPDYDAAVAALG